MDGLRIARTLAIWFHQSIGKQGDSFKPGPFVAPQDPSHQLRELRSEIEQLKAKLSDASQQLDSSQELTDLIAKEREEYAVLANQMDAEARTYEQLASEAEEALQKQKAEFEQRLKEMRTQLGGQAKVAPSVVEGTQKASSQFILNEELTRILIDQQLINAGWDADTQELTYKKGARPEKGKNKAIAEWPTLGKQAADYVAKQLTHEVIIDSDFVNRAFSTDGGAKRLNKILGNHLDEVLEELADRVWESAG